MDEAECYQWAVTNTGSDPFEVQKQQAADAEAEAQQQVQAQSQQVQQASQAQIDNFKKAFSACMEAKDYVAKF